MKHTDGPWFPEKEPATFNPIGAYQKAIVQEETTGIIPGFAFGKTKEECEANALLISSSPSMYNYILKKAEEGDPIAQKIIDSVHG